MIALKKYLLLCITLLSLQFAGSVSAAIYKCKTASGETVYSSKKCIGKSEGFTLNKENNIELQALALERNASKPSVDIYITSWCPYCKKAMAYLRSKNIAFNAYDIEKNARAKSKKRKLDPGYSGVPLTVINGKILKGFSASRFEKALNL